MTLELIQVASQIEKLVEKLTKSAEERNARFSLALGLLQSKGDDLAWIKNRILSSHTTWLPAEPLEKLTSNHSPEPCPAEHTVFSTDGSHIDVDRHSPVRCYLINIGMVLLNYGSDSTAEIESEALVYAEDSDLKIVDNLNSNNYVEVSGGLLGAKRSIEELRHLDKVASGLKTETPSLGLLDGTLVLWNLAGKDTPDFIRERLITETFLPILDHLKELNKERKIAVASYISLPRSTEVVNILRLLLCPHSAVNCDLNCRNLERVRIPCSPLDGIEDGEIFGSILKPGERSGLFLSRSSIMEKYGEHRIGFFYLKLEQEVVRVEMPAWVWGDCTLLNMVHAIILRQTRLGAGYPVVLQEAHERAVITGSDREAFRHLLETYLISKKLPVSYSEKSRSKRTRWV